jgi:hypothetical protein
MPAELGQHSLVGGGVKERNTSLVRAKTGSVSASSSGPRYGQWPGIRLPGIVWPVNPALFDTYDSSEVVVVKWTRWAGRASVARVRRRCIRARAPDECHIYKEGGGCEKVVY